MTPLAIAPVHASRADSITWTEMRRGARWGSFLHTSDALACLYDENWLARRIVDTYPAYAFKRGYVVEDDANDAIRKAFEALDHSDEYPEGKFGAVARKARLYGGAALLLLTNKDPALPITPADEVIAFDVVRRNQLSEISRDKDRNSPTFGQIDLYRIGGDHERSGAIVHASKLVLFEGLTQENRLDHWYEGPRWRWISVLRPVGRVVQSYGETWDSVSKLMREYSIGVLKMKGLIQSFADTKADVIEARLRVAAQSISMHNKLILDGSKDGEESFTRTPVTFADIPDLLVQYAQQISAAAEIPVTILMGTSPAGLNATGESDLRQFYDRVQIYTERSVEPKLERILSQLARKEVSVTFPPPWEPTDKEKADTRLANFQGDRVLFDMGGVSGSAIVKARQADGTLGLELEDGDVLDDSLPEPLPEAPHGAETPDIQAQVLNGAQIAEVRETVKSMFAGEIPRESAEGVLQVALPSLTPDQIAKILGPETFEPKEPEPAPSPFGGAPPAPKESPPGTPPDPEPSDKA